MSDRVTSPPYRVGCVSFLNSKPLIEALVGRADVRVRFAVPAQLLPLMEAWQEDTCLLPIVDYQMARRELLLVPAGAIGCDGPTLTVRIYSRVPMEQVRTLHADTDSHTSVILAQVILRERYGVRPEMRSLEAKAGEHRGEHETMLLIGDKVINAAPDSRVYPHQLDLGEAWKELTGLPFVFACWMVPADLDATRARGLARLLAESQRLGAGMTDALVEKYAGEKQWPGDLARRYFTEFLRYEVTERARAGIARFFELAEREGLLEMRRGVRYLEWEGEASRG